MNEQLGLRILNFFNFIYSKSWEGSICWHENEFHVTVTSGGNIYAYGQRPTLTEALDEVLSDLRKGGV
jgi:hypothetical protein